MARVYNKAKALSGHIPPDAIYVGRPTIWGNPFVAGLHGSRQEVVKKYSRYVQDSPDLMARLHELKGKDLVCWCAPLMCHADVLLHLANKEDGLGKEDAP